MSRILIIDEDLNPRLAAELRRRGRDARSVAQLGLRGRKDPQLLATIAMDYPGAVLVTADDHMPADHAEALEETKMALATIDSARPPGLTQEQWEVEVVQRWAHKIAEQPPGSCRRYGRAARDWTARKRRTAR